MKLKRFESTWLRFYVKYMKLKLCLFVVAEKCISLSHYSASAIPDSKLVSASNQFTPALAHYYHHLLISYLSNVFWKFVPQLNFPVITRSQRSHRSASRATSAPEVRSQPDTQLPRKSLSANHSQFLGFWWKITFCDLMPPKAFLLLLFLLFHRWIDV